MKTRKKMKWKNIILLVLLFISIICISLSATQLFDWNQDNKEIEKIEKDIEKNTTVQEVKDEDNEKIEIIEPVKEVPKENPYWDYVKMNLINVDFNELKKKNPDTVGWIQVNGTNVNYPFVQTTDNDFYLSHTFNRSSNSAGWVFLDYRNDLTNLDKNTILYAHARLDNALFGSLRHILTNGWLNNTNNFVVKLSTEQENTLWQVFSAYHIPTNNDYIQTDFWSDDSFQDWANMLIERSQYDFQTTIEKTDRVLTLSTCYSDSEKMVLHAKLIKKEAK